MKLPQIVYEVIRWLVSVVLPAVETFFATVANAWGWNLPIEAILTTLTAVETLLGALFLSAKYKNDKENKE